ncbi:Unknown protein, partial [Striga hermonthica]
TQELRSQIVSFAQQPNEPLHEAWERFKDLQRQCPHHNFPPALLMNSFYDSLHQNFQYMVDNATGGDIGAKTAEEMMEIFETMSTNSSQKSSRGKKAMVHEIAPRQDMIAHQIAELTEQMGLLNARSIQSVQAMTIESCGTCGVHGHRSEVCPSAFDQDFGEPHIDANALQGYQNQPVNDPYSNTYNPGWRNHPNFSWSNNNNTQQPRQNFMQQPNWPNFAPQQHMRPNFPQQQQPQRGPMGGMQNQGAGPSSATQDGKLDKILQFMTNQESTIKRMETQIGQLASRVGNLEAGSDKGKLPSQPEQAKAITVLRSGKVVNNQECAFVDITDPFVEKITQQEWKARYIPDFEDNKKPTVDLCTTDQPDAKPTLELKELPRHLKYVFLDEEMQKPVIIFAELAKDEERKLLEVLRTNKQAIGWGLGDLKGISPSTCMHRIVLEDGAKPFRDSQRRLNPNMMEVVKKEVLKLYSERLIFSVADSEWVSPIHVVPKKGGIT